MDNRSSQISSWFDTKLNRSSKYSHAEEHIGLELPKNYETESPDHEPSNAYDRDVSFSREYAEDGLEEPNDDTLRFGGYGQSYAIQAPAALPVGDSGTRPTVLSRIRGSFRRNKPPGTTVMYKIPEGGNVADINNENEFPEYDDIRIESQYTDQTQHPQIPNVAYNKGTPQFMETGSSGGGVISRLRGSFRRKPSETNLMEGGEGNIARKSVEMRSNKRRTVTYAEEINEDPRDDNDRYALADFRKRVSQVRASTISEAMNYRYTSSEPMAPGWDYSHWKPYGKMRYDYASNDFKILAHALGPYVRTVLASGCEGVEERKWKALTQSPDTNSKPLNSMYPSQVASREM